MSPLPRIQLSAQGRLGTACHHRGGASGRRETSAFLPLPPSSRYPTLGSPQGYLTPSLGSSFLRAGGRSTASHIPKETVGSYEKVGLALGSLFIAAHARRSHASVPQRSCTGLFIFPLLCFPLGRPSQECLLVWQTWGSRGGFGMSQRHLEGCGCAVAPARPRLGAHPSHWEWPPQLRPTQVGISITGAGAPHCISGAPACA